VGSGITNGGATNNVEIIDLSMSSSTCQDLPNLPIATYGSFGGLILQDYPLICGRDTGDRKKCFSYKVASWQESALLKTNRVWASYSPSPFLQNPHSLLVVGGGENVNTLEHFSENDWRMDLPKLPVTIQYGCMIKINSTTVMVIGGNQNKQISDKTFFLTKNRSVWIDGPKLLIPRCGHVCGMIQSDQASSSFTPIVVGGNDDNNNLATSEILDQGTGKWRVGPELPVGARSWFAALVEDAEAGVIYVGGYGGYTSAEYLTTLYRLAHAGDGSRWVELPQKLKKGRLEFVAFMIPDHLTNCN
jgi:hypothetical protein